MIDAATFANTYNAFWHANTPTCEHFVRQLNLSGLERFRPPMAESATSDRRALIAEFAFALFVERMKDAGDGASERQIVAIEEAAWQATETRMRPYVSQGLDLNREFDPDERKEVDELTGRLFRFFARPNALSVLRPIFSGCGFIDASEGDVIYEQTIFEAKTVERPFRSNDVRQVITYAALNFSSGQFAIKKIGLVNPRRGQYCDMDLEDICGEISGLPAEELLARIVQAISSGEISR